ncbi:MAG: ThiF family adenylyltransferase [Kofleriaceae bacterium]|nr:ThiF family adenylyltransferase [Kofleriaceae bacterium]MBP9169005.1 ThiF family adenylyltransferase [Kofleriaceae bacterium]MBP9858858.1 ThiF family adenylyltransferase [Kofleriaceae bacterium]
MTAGATVAVVGAGGLGGPIALALAEAGCRVVVFDDDRVELSNLHRQVHFTLADLGRPKAEVVATRARGRAITARFTSEVDLPCDAIVDGSDDPPTKFAVAAWARARRRPYVIAAALRYGGNVFAAGPDDACYACLFEDPPTDAATCGEAGVLGPVVGWVGGVAAQATLALLGGARGASIWVQDDLRRGAARTVALARRADCAACEAR